MPHIAVFMYPGRDHRTKQLLAQKVQTFLADALSIGKEIVSVSVEDVPREDWETAMHRIPADTMMIELES